MPLLGSVECVGRPEVDLANPDSLRSGVRASCPDILINAAAYTAVDQAESEPELAMKINGEAPGIMAEEMKRLRGLMVHYSTDFVYDGSGTEPWVEDGPTAPVNEYGMAKIAGDKAVAAAAGAHLILRTSWVYGARGRNFLRTILRLAEAGKPLRVVDDQIGSPTWSRDIATATMLIIERLSWTRPDVSISPAEHLAERSGIYHITSAGFVSWVRIRCGDTRELAATRIENQSSSIADSDHHTRLPHSCNATPQFPLVERQTEEHIWCFVTRLASVARFSDAGDCRMSVLTDTDSSSGLNDRGREDSEAFSDGIRLSYTVSAGLC